MLLREVGVRPRQRRDDPVGQLQPRAPCATRSARGSGRSTRPSCSSSSSSSVEARPRTGPECAQPSLLRPLDEQLVRLELLAGGADPAVAELLELARLQRRPHVAQARAELRPEHAQVRLVAEADGRPVEELDLLDAQLLLDLVERAPAAASAPRTTPGAAAGAASRPPRRARLPAELDDAAHLGDLGEEPLVRARRGVGQPARCTESGASAQAPATRFRHRCSARNGITRRDHAQRLRRARTTASGTRPRRTTRSGGASGGCTSSTGRRGTPRTRASRSASSSARRPPRSSRRRAAACARAARRRAAAPRRRPGGEILVRRPELLDVRVVDEERDRVPEREQPALDLVGRPVAELMFCARRLLAVQPAHDVGAHPLERLVASIALPHEPCISRPSRRAASRRSAPRGTASGRSSATDMNSSE